MATTGRIAADERGKRATLDDIQIGAEMGPVEWIITEEDIDGCCAAHNEYHEWFSVDSPFGGRIAPPLIAYIYPREIFKKLYLVRGLFVGWTSEHYDVIRPREKMVWKGRISDKYVRRDREWVWYEFVLTGEDGREILRTTRGHVLDFLKITTPKETVLTGAFAPDATGDPSKTIEEVYGPPVVTPRTTEEIGRKSDAPIWDVQGGDKDTPLGARLVPVSQQMSLRAVRDYQECMAAKYRPKSTWRRNIHTDVEVAKKEGLSAPNAGGPSIVGVISRMMLNFLGQGWVKGSRFNVRVIKQIMLDDFITAKGILTSKTLEGDRIRLECEVWAENQRGEKVVVGTASGPVNV